MYSSSSFWPKQTSSTGARCSNFCMSFPSPIAPFSSLRSYRYTFLSHDDTTKRVDSGSGENWTADITSEGGFATAKWSRKPCSVHGQSASGGQHLLEAICRHLFAYINDYPVTFNLSASLKVFQCLFGFFDFHFDFWKLQKDGGFCRPSPPFFFFSTF